MESKKTLIAALVTTTFALAPLALQAAPAPQNLPGTLTAVLADLDDGVQVTAVKAKGEKKKKPKDDRDDDRDDRDDDRGDDGDD